jgi:transcriptional regulator with PAS, ATPase and Fis domain
MMTQKKFRKDLYYRLKGGWLHLPPLKERKEDIPLLITGFIEEYCSPSGADIKEETMSLLMNYDYPGNIRELKSIIQSAVNLAQGKPISVKHLPAHLSKRKAIGKLTDISGSKTISPLAQVEKDHILNVYTQTGKNKSKTAKLLGIGLNTLRRRLESYGVSLK